jgi:hypothetical protein
MEGQWLAERYPGYKETLQSLTSHDGKAYDLIEIVTADGVKKVIYFDITSFFGKW